MARKSSASSRVELQRRDQAYATIASSAEFHELRRRFRRFVLPATAIFMAWYLLYVVCANWAGDLMSTKVLGNINVALLFGLAQFVSTFLIAWLYSRYARRRLDPTAEALDTRFATLAADPANADPSNAGSDPAEEVRP